MFIDCSQLFFLLRDKCHIWWSCQKKITDFFFLLSRFLVIFIAMITNIYIYAFEDIWRLLTDFIYIYILFYVLFWRIQFLCIKETWVSCYARIHIWEFGHITEQVCMISSFPFIHCQMCSVSHHADRYSAFSHSFSFLVHFARCPFWQMLEGIEPITFSLRKCVVIDSAMPSPAYLTEDGTLGR